MTKKEFLLECSKHTPFKEFNRSWCLGGTSNSWDGNTRIVSSEEEPEFTGLDEFLVKFLPNITFLQYKLILKLAIETDEYCADYYGGEIHYKKSTIKLEDMYELFKELNLI